jgi:hypothetical protein
VYVTGNSWGNGTNYDFATVAYSSDGMTLWAHRYNGPANLNDSATALAVDNGDNVIVTGESSSTGVNSDWLTIKLSSAGVPSWTNRYEGPGNSYDSAKAIAVDPGGTAYVTGSSASTNIAPYNLDYVTMAFDSSGNRLWTNRYNGPGNSDDVATAVRLDGSNNVYVTGYSTGAGSGRDYATIKYSSAGVPLWTNRYSAAGNNADSASALAVAANGNVYVTGSSAASGSSFDYATIAYSSGGVPLWTNRYNGPVNGADSAAAIALDSSGNVWVTGYSAGTGGANDYATIAYSSAGTPLWTNRYDGPGNSVDQALATVADGSGGVYVTGYSRSTAGSGSEDYLTIKYAIATLLPIPLNHQVSGQQLVLSWTNAAFDLQSASAVQGTYTNVPGATSPYTNLLIGGQQFFKLKAN